MKRIVVVGGVAGGMSFATRYRRLNEDDHIIVLDKGPYVSFANCGLPYHISGEIEERSDLLVADQTMLQNRFQLDIRVNHEVIHVDPELKELTVLHEGKESKVAYDSLVLSPGANPFIPDIEGMNLHPSVYTVRNIPDVDAIMTSLPSAKHVVVIGAGFIGLEMAESLHNRGLRVSIIERESHVLGPFDEELAILAHNELVRNGINVYTSASVTRMSDQSVFLEDNTEIEADIVILSVGVAPATGFIDCVEKRMRGGIVVDEAYKTSQDDIYAVGDAIIVRNQINNQDALISLASPANRQGRQLADNLSGLINTNKGSIGTAIVRIFNLSFASTGLNERQLKGNQNIEIMHLLGKSNAGYFPGATPIQLKVIFDADTHLILGAQAVGQKGVDKRIDIIATAIKAKITIDELQELEFTYAPPYGSAKDIVNMAGYVGFNIIHKITTMVQWHEVKNELKQGAILVDVRNIDEFNNVHIQGSINLPLDTLRCGMNQLKQDSKLIVFCQSGVRSYNAERILKQAGYTVANLDGSFELYARMFPEELVYSTGGSNHEM